MRVPVIPRPAAAAWPSRARWPPRTLANAMLRSASSGALVFQRRPSTTITCWRSPKRISTLSSAPTALYPTPLETLDDFENELQLHPDIRWRAPLATMVTADYRLKLVSRAKNSFTNYQTHTFSIGLRPRVAGYRWSARVRVLGIPSMYLRTYKDRDYNEYHAARFRNWDYEASVSLPLLAAAVAGGARGVRQLLLQPQVHGVRQRISRSVAGRVLCHAVAYRPERQLYAPLVGEYRQGSDAARWRLRCRRIFPWTPNTATAISTKTSLTPGRGAGLLRQAPAAESIARLPAAPPRVYHGPAAGTGPVPSRPP